MKIRLFYRIEDGILKGTEISVDMAFVLVKYPHRKTQDVYWVTGHCSGSMPSKEGAKQKSWHCCRLGCPTPDFPGGIDQLVDHLMLHKGRLIKWNDRRGPKTSRSWI